MSGTWPFVILVKYASRGRKQRFLDGLHNIYDMCAQPDYIRVLITADEDDSEMNNDGIRGIVERCVNAEIIYGKSENKIHAINRDFDKMPEHFKDWDIVVNFSDDMRFTMQNWDDYIRVDFNSISPDFSHYIAYRDPDTHGALSTMLIAGRKFYDMFGFVYDPIFIALFCDNQVEDAAKALGKYHYTGYSIYRHHNPAYKYADFPEDAMFRQQQDIGWDVDQKTYYKLKEEGIEKYLSQFNLKINEQSI